MKKIVLLKLVCYLFVVGLAIGPATAKSEVKDLLYAGLNDGTVHLCKPIPLSKEALESGQEQCEKLNSLGYAITAMAFGNNVLYVGTKEGKVFKCNPLIMDRCEYMNNFGSTVSALTFYNNRLFAGTKYGVMLSCDPIKIDGCSDLNYLGSAINVMKIEAGRVYAGTDNGALEVCSSTEIPHTCKGFSTTGSGSVTAIEKVGDYIYAANNEITRCHYIKGNECTTFYKPGAVDNSNWYYSANMEYAKNRIIVSYSHKKSKLNCGLHSCTSYWYWDKSKIVGCKIPGKNDSSSVCNTMQTGEGLQDAFEIGKAHGANFHYSIEKKLWFQPYVSETRTNDFTFNSHVTELLYVER